MNYIAIPGLKNQVHKVIGNTLHKSIIELYEQDRRIIHAVCSVFNITMNQLTANTNKRESVAPRQVAMYLMAHKTNLSYNKIGCLLGNKNHATVSHSITVVSNEIYAKTKTGNIATKLMEEL